MGGEKVCNAFNPSSISLINLKPISHPIFSVVEESTLYKEPREQYSITIQILGSVQAPKKLEMLTHSNHVRAFVPYNVW